MILILQEHALLMKDERGDFMRRVLKFSFSSLGLICIFSIIGADSDGFQGAKEWAVGLYWFFFLWPVAAVIGTLGGKFGQEKVD